MSAPLIGPAADPVGAVSKAAAARFHLPLPADPGAYAGLPPTRFADPADRRFPVCDPVAALNSAACYLHQGGDPAAALGGRLKQACEAFGFGAVWADMAAKAAAAPPPAGRFCLPDDARYPVDTPAQVKRAAAYLAGHADALGAKAAAYATNLLAAADAVGGLDAAAYAAVERTAGRVLPGGFTPSEAKAAAADLCVTPGGWVYRRTDLDALPADAVTAVAGPVAGLSRSKRAAALAGPQAEAMTALLDAYGVHPVGRMVAPAGPADRVDWESLAG